MLVAADCLACLAHVVELGVPYVRAARVGRAIEPPLKVGGVRSRSHTEVMPAFA